MVIREAKKRHQQESTNPAGAAWRYEGLGIRRLIRFGLGRRCILVWYMSICGGKDRGREENVGLWADAHRTSMPSHGIPGTFKRLSSRMRAIEKNTFSATADPSRFPSRLLATRSIPNSPPPPIFLLSQFASVDTVNYLAQVSSILNGA